MDIYETALRIIHESQQQLNGHAPFIQVNWAELAVEETELEWLVEGFWPASSHVHLFAGHKTGKSLLTLHTAVQIALGLDAFNGGKINPHDVVYIDREMTRADIRERLFDMGMKSAMLSGALERLHYYFYPSVGYLDTPEGGHNVMELVKECGSDVVIIDTLSRVVKGDENSNDTYRNFYNYTGALLKSEGIALLRLDHEGHQTGHSRGASSKGDDVDLVYHLKPTDSGLDLVMKASRVDYVKHEINLQQGLDTLGFSETVHGGWPEGTKDKVKELDSLGIPEGSSFRKTKSLLREHGHLPGKSTVLLAAIRYRKERVDIPGLQP